MSLKQVNHSTQIMVISNDRATLDTLRDELRSENYEATFVTTSSVMMENLSSNQEGIYPIDIIILDIMQPEKTGFQILKAIRENPGFNHTQIMLLADLPTIETRIEAIEMGANDLLSKPCTHQDLHSHLAFLLQRKSIHRTVSYLSDGINALYKSGQALLGVHSQAETLQIILEELGNLVKCDSASIMLVDGNCLQMTASIGFHDPEQQFSYEDLEKLDHVQATLRSQQAVVIPNTFDDRRWVHLANSDYIVSWMGVPLIVKGKAIGLLNIDCSKPNYFTDLDLEVAKAFASQAALAIDNARILEHLEMQSKLTRALVQVGRNLAATRELDTQLQEITRFVQEHLKAPMFYLGLYDKFTGTLKLKSVYDMGIPQPEISLAIRDDQNAGLASHVIRNRVAINWDDEYEKQTVVSQLNLRMHRIGSISRTSHTWPLIFESEVVGVICIQSDKPRAWKQVEIDIFSALSNLVAAAVSNSRIFEDFEYDQNRLLHAFDASKDLATDEDWNHVLDNIVEKLQKIMNAARVSIVLMDEDGNPIHRSAVGYEREIGLATSIRPNGLSQQVFSAKTPIFMEDLLEHRDRVHPKMLEQGLKSAVCLPLAHEHLSIGVLWVHFREPHRFSVMEKETLRLYAEQATTAYEKNRRIHDLEQLRAAAQAFSGAGTPAEVLQLIVSTAKKEFRADSIALWSFDEKRQSFILDSSVADGIPDNLWMEFKRNEPLPGKTAYKVMDDGWIGVVDIHNWHQSFQASSSTIDLLSRIGISSFQGIALKVGDERLGVLYINYIKQRGFGSTERETARAFANQAALALKKAKLVDQLERAQRTARIVAETTSLGDYQGTIQSIVDGIQNVVGSDTVTLYSYDDETDRFAFPPAFVGVYYPEKITELDQVVRNSVPYKIIQMDEMYVAEFAETDPVLQGNFTEREEIRSFVGVPLVSQGRRVGVICLSFRHRHRSTSSELSTIDLFARQAALAIQHATLFKTVKENRDILNALYYAGRAITESLDRNDILRAIAIQAYEITGIHGVSPRSSSVGILEDQERLVFQAAFPAPYLAGLQAAVPYIQINQSSPIGISGRAVRLGLSQLTEDVLQDPDYIGFDAETRSELAVPILIGDQVTGVINVEHPQLGAFGEEDRQALEALATYASIALENASIFNELREAKKRVQSMTNLAWVGTVAGAWRHAISNHSVIISDLVQLIRQDLANGKPLSDIYFNISQIEGVINQIQEIPVLPLSAEEGVDSVLVNQLITDRLKQYSQKKGRYEKMRFLADLSTDSSVTVRASREWLRRLLDNLINNAVNAMKDSAVKDLVIHTRVEHDRLVILVTDTGTGIPQHIQPILFRSPIRKAKGEKGSGLGLLISAEIALTYQGCLDIESTSSEGTTIRAWFPLEK